MLVRERVKTFGTSQLQLLSFMVSRYDVCGYRTCRAVDSGAPAKVPGACFFFS